VFRVLVVGDTAVGKTSFIARYVRNEFPCHQHPRRNSDGSTIYHTIIDGRDYTLIFVDISTAYDIEKLKFSDTIPTACLILFSITDQRSFSRLNYFYEAIHLKSSYQAIQIPIFIVANKIDLEQDRAVSQESIDKIKSNGCDVFDISVKGNVGIGDVIYTAIKHLQYDLLEKVKPNDACACIIA
jgi:GTPase SAR1 family protein